MASPREIIIISSDDEDSLIVERICASPDVMMIGDSDENCISVPIIDEYVEISSSDDGTELPSAEDCIRYVPTVIKMETGGSIVTPPDTPPCQQTSTPRMQRLESPLEKDTNTCDRYNQSIRTNFISMKKFSLNIPSLRKKKLENSIETPLSREELLQITPPTCHHVAPRVDHHETVCSFSGSVVDYIESVSDVEQCSERFISPSSVLPTDLVMKLVTVVRDSTDTDTALAAYNIVRHSMVLSTPQLHLEDIWNCIDPVVHDIKKPGFMHAMNLIVLIIERLQKSKLGRPFNQPDRWKSALHAWKSPLCEWLSTSMTSQVMLQAWPSLPTVHHLLRLVTLYCTDCQDQSIRDGLASSWVIIYNNVTSRSKRKDLLQNIGNHEMRGSLLDKLLSSRFHQTSDILNTPDRLIWSSQSPSLSKTVYLHFYRQPHRNSSEYAMLLSYLLQSNIMSHLSTNYRLSINRQCLTEEYHKLKSRIAFHNEDQFTIDLAVELAHTLSNS